MPEPGRGELLLRVRAATTCGTDLKAYVRGHPQIPMPGVFGHEYSGVVAAAGKDARFQEGDEVMGVHSAPCQGCPWCLRGQDNLCETVMATKVLGSYAEYLLIPERIARVNVFAKPPDLPFGRASLLEPLACVAEGVRKMRVAVDSRRVPERGLSVLVIGPGAIGLMFAIVLRDHEVTVAGRDPERLAVAARAGARTVTWEALRDGAGSGFDVVIECTGSVEVWERAPHFVRRGGLVVLFGGCPSGTRASFDTARLHYDEVGLISPFHFGLESVRCARDWLCEAQDAFGMLLSSERPLEGGPAVFEELKARKGIKVVLRP